MPDKSRRRWSRRRTEEAWIIAITVLALSSMGLFWIASVYSQGQ